MIWRRWLFESTWVVGKDAEVSFYTRFFKPKSEYFSLRISEGWNGNVQRVVLDCAIQHPINETTRFQAIVSWG